MATFTKRKLESASDGRGISITATSSPGTTVHTAHASAQDEIYLYLRNTHTSAVTAIIEFGGTTAASDAISQTIAVHPSGLVLVVPGFPLTNSTVVKVWCATTAVLSAFGFVNRIA